MIDERDARSQSIDSQTFDLIDSLSRVEDTNLWWLACLAALRHRGVESVCYGMVPFTDTLAKGEQIQSAIVRSTHPREWSEAVLDTGLLEHELTAELALGGSDTVLWHDERL